MLGDPTACQHLQAARKVSQCRKRGHPLACEAEGAASTGGINREHNDWGGREGVSSPSRRVTPQGEEMQLLCVRGGRLITWHRAWPGTDPTTGRDRPLSAVRALWHAVASRARGRGRPWQQGPLSRPSQPHTGSTGSGAHVLPSNTVPPTSPLSPLPNPPFMGVRISWLMFARKRLLARLAASAASLATRSSSACWRYLVRSCHALKLNLEP